VKTGMDEWL